VGDWFSEPHHVAREFTNLPGRCYGCEGSDGAARWARLDGSQRVRTNLSKSPFVVPRATAIVKVEPQVKLSAAGE
jgi:hypothetical protein